MLINSRSSIQALLAVSALVIAEGCGSSPPQGAESVSKSSFDLSGAADAVSRDVGKILKTNSSGKKGPIFVIEEFHTSRIGQLQIATMLVRLHDKYGALSRNL